MVEATRPYLELPHFNRDIIQNKSKAAAGLCDWAVNIVKYFDVVIDVAPKKAELAEANAKLEDANSTLTVVMAQVAELNKMVADLESQFEEANADKNGAIAEQERCDRKLDLANRLITALSSEGERWAATVDQVCTPACSTQDMYAITFDHRTDEQHSPDVVTDDVSLERIESKSAYKNAQAQSVTGNWLPCLRHVW